MARFNIWTDSMGNIYGAPVNKRYHRKIAIHMEEMTGHADGIFFIQEGMGTNEFMQDLPRDKAKDLDSGWDITLNADLWTFAHYYGWDCHTLFE